MTRAAGTAPPASTGPSALPDPAGQSRPARLPRWLSRDRVAVLAALLGPFAACVLLALVRSSVPNTDAALVLVLVVVAVAANGFRAAGYLAAVSAAVWFDFFLTQPYQRFTIDRVADVRTTVLLLLVGIAVTEIAVWGRRKATLASGQEAYLAGIREATQIASSGGSGRQLVDDVAGQLARVLGVAKVRFEYGAAGLGEPARLRRDGEVEWRHQVWDVDRRGLPTGIDVELLVESRGRLIGRYLMRARPDSKPTRSERLVAVTLASPVGAGVR
jgi:K+-sensing histidine kinase KdpD